MTGQQVLASWSGMRFAKLGRTYYREWVTDRQDFLEHEVLWCLTIRKEKIQEELKQETRFDKNYE